MSRFHVKTPKELSNMARDKIGETQSDLVLARKQVRKIVLEKYPDLQLPSDADNLFDRCLRTRKFDVESAAAQVHQFYKFLSDFYALHNEIPYFLPSTHKKVYFASHGYAVFKYTDNLGRPVVISNFDKMPANVYTVNQAVAAVILMVTELTRVSVDVQRLGIVFILNMNNFHFGHARQFTARKMNMIARMVQGAFPVRIKGFHVVNCRRIISLTYAVIKPFLGEKIKSRIHFYGTNLTSFHEHISPDILPNFLGGRIPDHDFIDEDFSKRLITLDDYYTEFLQCGYLKR